MAHSWANIYGGMDPTLPPPVRVTGVAQGDRPVVIGKIYGWRAFKVSGSTLKSPTMNKVWGEAEYSARCGKHVPPGQNCSCGLYVYSSLDMLLRNINQYSTDTVALVSMWGKIAVHAYGYRAQHARIERVFTTLDRDERDRLARAYNRDFTVNHWPGPGTEEGVEVPHLFHPKLPALRHQTVTLRAIPQREVPHDILEEFTGDAYEREIRRERRIAKSKKAARRLTEYARYAAFYAWCEDCDAQTPWAEVLVHTGFRLTEDADPMEPVPITKRTECLFCGEIASAYVS